MATTHRLLTKEPATRTGICSECGSTRIAQKGAYWRCAGANASQVTKWRQANEPKARAANARNRKRAAGRPKAHALTDQDMVTLTGVCVECGPVEIMRHGWGWVCPTRQHCRCDDEVLWEYRPPHCRATTMCEGCAKALAKGFVKQGLLEPVIEMTWPESRVSWDQAARELEAA